VNVTTVEQQTDPKLGFWKRFFSRFRRNANSLTTKCQLCGKVGLKTKMHHEYPYGYFCNYDHFWEQYIREVW
jgi:hypothetical protein